MIYSTSGASAGIGFAVPVDTVRRSINQLIRHGRVARPGLGINVFMGPDGAMGLPGVLIMNVPPGSDAARAGLRGTVQDKRSGQTVLGARMAHTRARGRASATFERAHRAPCNYPD